MEKRLKVLMAEFHAWNSTIQVGSHKYCANFLRDGCDVTWIASFWHALSFRKGTHLPDERRLYLRGRMVEFGEHLKQYSPFTLLPHRDKALFSSPFMLNNMLKATVPHFPSWLAKNGLGQPDVFWLTNAYLMPMLEFVKPRLLVHRMADDLASFGHVPETVLEAEKELVIKADLVLVTSKALMQKVRAMGNEPVYVPNGVDYPFFQRRDLPEPEDLVSIPHPRVIYIGAIDHWFDFDLLRSAARILSGINFVVVGPSTVSTSEIADLPNVKLLGRRPYTSVPAYLTHCDAAIIPFKKNTLTDNINPIKLYEYLAAGRPVVSTDLDETRSMDPPASFASDARSFAAAIESELELGADRQEFRQFALENSWESRYKRVKEEIQCRLK